MLKTDITKMASCITGGVNKAMKRLHFSWIHFISLRLSGLSRKKINGEKGFSFARIAPSLGIGVGVMALIVIIAVMKPMINEFGP